MSRWVCYALCAPDDREIFYIGITRRLWSERLSQHKTDPASAAYQRLRRLKVQGLEPVCVVLKSFGNEEAARIFERSMIVLIGDVLLNREPRWPLVGGELERRRDYDQPWAATQYDTYEPIDDGWEVPRLRRKEDR